jgi:methylmalonyl-CoA/ethylmalonyl-CoA epimerase
MGNRIDHVGIAVKDVREPARLYGELLGLEHLGDEEVPGQNVKISMYRAGESKVEFLEDPTGEGPISKFIEKRGEGIHHICLGVDDIDATLEKLKKEGVRLIDENARPGAGGARVAFVFPVNGVLLELCERDDD